MIDTEQLFACAKRFSVDLTREQAARFDRFAELLVDWNSRVNLTAITEPADIVIKHFEDSLALLPALGSLNGKRIADVGTGAGFPSVPLLIASDGKADMTMIEATNKKLVFLDAALRALDLSATLLHRRAEEAGRDPLYREQFDIVTARAVAELRVLAEYCLPLVRTGGVFVAMKAALCDRELSDAQTALATLGGRLVDERRYTLSNGDARVLLVVKKISQTSSKYPRSSALLAKKPL